MRKFDVEVFQKKRKECLENCFKAFVENGFENTGMQSLSKYCGFKTNQALYHYFNCKDQIVRECVDYALDKMTSDLKYYSPKTKEELYEYVRTVPKVMSEKYSDEFCLIIQVYTSPQYREEGHKYAQEVPIRYEELSQNISKRLNAPIEEIRPPVYLFVTSLVYVLLFQNYDFYSLQAETIVKLFSNSIDGNNRKN